MISDLVAGTAARVFRTAGSTIVPGVKTPGELHIEVGEIVADSRDAGPGSVFVALKGEEADGHKFVADALAKGAIGAIVGRSDTARPLPDDKLLFVVKDPLKGLQDLAAHWRRKHDVTVVGVTGSVGKTTVKEAVAWTLSSLGENAVLKNRANRNTEIGLPLELLRLGASHKVAVLEMGMYQVGDIALLARVAAPDLGVVTNVHPNHLERTGSIERTAHGKAELIHALPSNGLAILNGDDPRVRAMSCASRAPAILFGVGRRYDFAAAAAVGRGHLGFDAEIRHGTQEMSVRCPTPGVHNATNLLPAVAVAHRFGIPWESIRQALETFHLDGRIRFLPGPNGSILLDDRYNASAASVIAAMKLLTEEPGRHFALLGDMYELGHAEEEQHRMVGRAAAALDGLILLGPRTRWIAEEALRRGLPSTKIVQVSDNEQAAGAARELLARGDVMLIKGSRGLRLETVVRSLSTEIWPKAPVEF